MNNKLKQNQTPRNKKRTDGCWGEGLVGNAGVGGKIKENTVNNSAVSILDLVYNSHYQVRNCPSTMLYT